VISVQQPSVLYLYVVRTDEASDQQRSFAISVHESRSVSTVTYIMFMQCDFFRYLFGSRWYNIGMLMVGAFM